MNVGREGRVVMLVSDGNGVAGWIGRRERDPSAGGRRDGGGNRKRRKNPAFSRVPQPIPPPVPSLSETSKFSGVHHVVLGIVTLA